MTVSQKIKYSEILLSKIRTLLDSGVTIQEIAAQLEIPERSLIAKLSSLGLYKRKEYTNKNGEKPIRKGEYVDRIAKLLAVDVELLESLEKANKNVLKMLEDALSTE
jgi:DNA-binding transcriptional MerR regulator